MRYCENCRFLKTEGYEYPETYCPLVPDDDPKFDEDDKGCGCHYNIRTLEKRQRENDHAEYLYFLGYTDYYLMPTLEHTEENEKILEKYRDLLRHALGMDNNKTYTRHGKKFYRPYRNYFSTNEKTVDYPYWETMAKEGCGLASKQVNSSGEIMYSVTRAGMDWLGQHDGVHIYDESWRPRQGSAGK